MFYTIDNPLYEVKREVIKLELKVNTKDYPNFPSEIYVSEFNFQSAITSLMGLDSSIKNSLNLSDEEYDKTWIAFRVRATHTTNDNYFGVNGNTLLYQWK